jgi:hypothetical protein
MTKEELAELIRRVIEVDGTEQEIDACIEAISNAVPHPSWTDLVYHNDRDLSPEEVAEVALAYKPIQL